MKRRENMTLTELKTTFIEALLSQYPKEEVTSFFNLLSEKHLQLSRVDITIKGGMEVSEETITVFSASLERLKKNEPVQYIIGDTEFYGLSFLVTKDVLIPRPETEELVSWVLDDHRMIRKEMKILDIGTGSGCIAISIAKNLKSNVTALDVSTKALALAHENAERNSVVVNFQQLDILEASVLSEKYHTIVSNPPYVREIEMNEMSSNVLEYEPASALYVTNEDPLVFYRKIARLARQHLVSNGTLYFEINEYLSRELCILLKEIGFSNIVLRKDIFGKDRMIKCSMDE